MSRTQMILKRDPFPVLDDPEKDTGSVGVQKRPDADTYAERRGPDGFLKSSEGIEFNGENRAGVYAWTERLLVALEFAVQDKKQRGAIRKNPKAEKALWKWR